MLFLSGLLSEFWAINFFMDQIADIRKDYKQRSLHETDVVADPIQQFGAWWNEALASHIEEVNAMTIASVSADGTPSARIVLLKGFSQDGFVFYTNYNSHKGHDIAANNKVSLLFFWKELERQVRIDGIASKISAEQSDAYFDSRPQGSRISAMVSPQSEVIPSREFLESKVKSAESEAGTTTVRPPHWGGYIVQPENIEFWQGRPSRLHDRIRYKRADGAWTIERLAP